MKIKSRFKSGITWVKDNYYFVLVIISILFALSLIIFLTFGSYYRDAKENAVIIGSMTVTQEARRIEDAMSTDINALLMSSYTVDSMLKRGADTREISDYMVQETQGYITGIDPGFSGIYGVVNDVYVDGIGWAPEEGYDPYERPWYVAAAAKKGGLAIVTPYLDAQTGSIMLSFSKILCDGKSAISLDARLDNIHEVTDTIQLAGKGYCFLADRGGNVIAHRDESQVGKNYLTDPSFDGSDERALIERVLASSGEEAPSNFRMNGDKTMVFTQSVMDEWFVVLVVESSDVFYNTRASLAHSIMASLVIFIIVGYFCASNYINRKRAIRYAENIRIDVLTGLNNRGEFDRYLHTTVTGIPTEKKMYLMLFDADKFKSINDTFGHPEGDNALRLIAKTLMSVCHGTDCFCARYGGDEFVIICKCDDEAVVRNIIDSVDSMLAAVTLEEHLPYKLSLSCGYACFNPAVQSITELIDMADHDLYSAKERKKQPGEPSRK